MRGEQLKDQQRTCPIVINEGDKGDAALLMAVMEAGSPLSLQVSSNGTLPWRSHTGQALPHCPGPQSLLCTLWVSFQTPIGAKARLPQNVPLPQAGYFGLKTMKTQKIQEEALAIPLNA